ncbi:MAG: Na/Pi symporter [Defluviicoccus sp.]|nr:Na/Pi symporter [Defluviicoccus sp.]
MNELFAGIAGGLGLFIFGMWLLTENLKALATRRLRTTAARWTGNRFSALAWGALAGAITQSMSATTFIVVSILRSGLITTRGALALILGGCVGVSALVVIVTFDIKVVSLYVLGIAAAVVVTERLSKFKPVAASFLGGAFIILGLVLIKDAAAPLAEQPWFRELLEGVGDSLVLAFLVGALLTFIVQSSSAVTVFGISLAAVGLLSVDQAIMIMYGSLIGSGAILYVLSAGLTGRSRQVAMYLVGYNALICAVLVPLLYFEIHFDVPLVKAWARGLDLDLDQQLAAVYVFLCVFLLPMMFAGLGWSAALLERLWPTSAADALARPRFIHDHASVDVETSVVLVDLEQRRAMRDFSEYFDAVRRGDRIAPLRAGTRQLLSDIVEFLDDLHTLHPMHGVEDQNSLRNRQKLLAWLEDSLGVMCETLAEIDERSALGQLRTTICESVDGVLLSLVDAIESDDSVVWDLTRKLTGDRGEMMRDIRTRYLQREPPLQRLDLINVLLITNAVEETFFLFSKIENEANPASGIESHVPQT